MHSHIGKAFVTAVCVFPYVFFHEPKDNNSQGFYTIITKTTYEKPVRLFCALWKSLLSEQKAIESKGPRLHIIDLIVRSVSSKKNGDRWSMREFGYYGTRDMNPGESLICDKEACIKLT